LVIAAVIGGLAPGLLQDIPQVRGLETVPCLAFVLLAFLGGPLLSVWIYRSLSGGLTRRQALTAGVAAGIAASLPGLVIVLDRVVEAPRQLATYPSYLPIPGWFAVGFGVFFSLLRVILAIFLGSLAGVIARAIFVTGPPESQAGR
jgi:hypothetical protein